MLSGTLNLLSVFFPPYLTLICFHFYDLMSYWSDLYSSFWQMQDKVGASPIDIAKAYMGTRTSEVGLGSKSLLSTDERTSPNGDEFALKPYFPSSSPKPSTCWPGAMLQDQRDYLTPHSERGSYGLHNFPRTPYSRTIFSKSKSKVCGIGFNCAVMPLNMISCKWSDSFLHFLSTSWLNYKVMAIEAWTR